MEILIIIFLAGIATLVLCSHPVKTGNHKYNYKEGYDLFIESEICVEENEGDLRKIRSKGIFLDIIYVWQKDDDENSDFMIQARWPSKIIIWLLCSELMYLLLAVVRWSQTQ